MGGSRFILHGSHGFPYEEYAEPPDGEKRSLNQGEANEGSRKAD